MMYIIVVIKIKDMWTYYTLVCNSEFWNNEIACRFKKAQKCIKSVPEEHFVTFWK